MKIKSMTASFGGLDYRHLELKDGLNILHAPNEGGKSTWCAFIRAMFYGVPSRDRDKKGYLAEKNRYQPWSGASMEGEMTLEWRGKDITLRRFTKGAVPFGGFSAVYTDTQLPVPDLTGQNCGELLLGVGREVWERSAFIGSAPTLAIDGTSELERRIAALVSSGEEDVSFSQTDARLREWLRRRQHNKTGLIPKLEEELAKLDAELAKLSDAHNRFAGAQSDIARLEQEQKQLLDEQHVHKRMAERELNKRYGQALQRRAELELRAGQMQAVLPDDESLLQARQRLGRLDVFREDTMRRRALRDAAEVQLEQAQQACPDHPLNRLTHAQQEELCRQVRRKHEKAARLRWLSALGPVAALGLGALLLWRACPPLVILGSAAAVCAGVMVPLLVLARKVRRKAGDLLVPYGAASVQALSALWQERQTLCARLEQAQAQAEQSRQEYDRAAALQQTEERELSAFVGGFAPEAKELSQWAGAIDRALEQRRQADCLHGELEQIRHRCADLEAQGAREIDTLEMLHQPQNTPEQTARQLAQTEQALSVARSAMAMAQGEMLSAGDRTALEAYRQQLQLQLDHRRMEYEAISLALDSLRQANETLQERFAPELNRRAGEILARLTAGRYAGVALNREFDAAAQSADSLLPRSSLALSRGTADQIYLAVRLAVCQLCLSEEDPSPLVLDDALLTFDDARMGLALRYLSETGRQVLLFSCQQRESVLGIGNSLPLHS